jgi:glutaminase
MMAKAVTDARRPDATAGTDAIYRGLFDSFNPDSGGRISPLEVLSRLERSGLQPDDPRIAEALAGLAGADGGSRQISFTQFKALAQHNSSLIRRAVEGSLAVPDFAALTADIARMYDELLTVTVGVVADDIPQLKRVDPDQLGIALCTVDGQRFSAGDATTAFCLQSVSKTVSYCLAPDEHGTEAVHQHVGREPSGQSFNELALNPKGLPHNPMVNAGAIMTTSLIRPEEDIADRFDLVAATWRRLAGGRRPGFNNAVYLSERQTADRNFALGYSMRESGAFRPGTDLLPTLEFYFQACSIEVDAEMLVIPGLMSICVWSPRLDAHGNSVDRWGGTPLSDADGNGHTEIAALLREHAEEAAPLSRSDQREAAG